MKTEELNKLKDLASFLEEQIKKLEGEKPNEVNSYSDAIFLLCDKDDDETIFDDIEVDVENFRNRLTIAKALGSREFVFLGKNWGCYKPDNKWLTTMYMEFEHDGINYFPTKEQAERYLEICLKEDLL